VEGGQGSCKENHCEEAACKEVTQEVRLGTLAVWGPSNCGMISVDRLQF
jgi:hypothetical protein